MTGEEEDSHIVTVTLMDDKKSKGIRFPFDWVPYLPRWFKGEVTLYHELCQAPNCDEHHIYFLEPGEQPPICPKSILICPQDGHPFKYDKKEQKRLRERYG